jgi:hypothetical protein
MLECRGKEKQTLLGSGGKVLASLCCDKLSAMYSLFLSRSTPCLATLKTHDRQTMAEIETLKNPWTPWLVLHCYPRMRFQHAC